MSQKYKGKGIKGWSKSLAGSGFQVEAGKGTSVKVINEDGLYLWNRRSLKAAVESINEAIRKDNCPIDNPRYRATILAALRYWQLQLNPKTGDEFNACKIIATDDGAVDPLSASEIDVLCETINP